MMKIGLMPKPTQMYGVAASITGESNMHGLQEQQKQDLNGQLEIVRDSLNSTKNITVESSNQNRLPDGYLP